MGRNKNRAELIVEKIIGDLSDRCGIGDYWDDIDDETQQEIKDTWASIIVDVLEVE